MQEVLDALTLVEGLIANGTSAQDLTDHWTASIKSETFLVVDAANQISVAHTLGLCQPLDNGKRLVALFNNDRPRLPQPLLRTPQGVNQQSSKKSPRNLPLRCTHPTLRQEGASQQRTC